MTAKTKTPPRADMWNRILVLSSAVVGVTLLVRSAISPLIGYDTSFRWDFLAHQILALHRFDFYPPLIAADFHNYFAVDAIPPLVSFTHWWLYASLGRYAPSVISIFVTAQFASTLAFTYGIASTLFSRRAGFLAAATLAACPLYFRSVVLGQETGLTALSVAATLYFIVSAKERGDVRAMLSAGLAAGLCALSREYGWIVVPAGIIALLWRRHNLRNVLIFVITATAAALPWYARNSIVTGNPFYTLSFGNLPVNPVYNGILEHYREQFGVQHWRFVDWTGVLWLLLISAPIQVLGGIIGGVQQFRRYGYLMIIALLLAVVWIQSAGYTSGGLAISTRVLSPVMVMLSILAAERFERLARYRSLHTWVMVAVVACQMWTALHGVFYPNDPTTLPLRYWRESVFQPAPDPIEFQIRDQLVRTLPAGTRVLSDNAYLHAALIEKGVEAVPVWSPEVRFLFFASPEEADRRLQSLGISGVAYYPESLNTSYLATASPFYASLPQRWHVLITAPGFIDVFVPKEHN